MSTKYMFSNVLPCIWDKIKQGGKLVSGVVGTGLLSECPWEVTV
jgi:hypothetical protein